MAFYNQGSQMRRKVVYVSNYIVKQLLEHNSGK